MKIKHVLYICALFSIVGWSGPFEAFFHSRAGVTAPVGSTTWIDQEAATIHSEAPNINTDVVKLGLTAYVNVRRQGLDNKQMLTIVDYSKPSNERRLWVVDLKTNKVLFNTWVAHGRNSGDLNSTSFSNSARSLKSSLGVFVTEDTYDGHNGYSLRVQGLERGINDNAYSRSVVFHGADYASPAVAKELGRLGRSWGCFAVGRNVIAPLINTIKNQTVVFAYYPDKRWLQHSSYL
jgi:hypothetical protein